MKRVNEFPACVLCDTTYIAEYEDYVDNCEGNDLEPEDEDSQDYWDYVHTIQEMEWDDLKCNLECSKTNDTPVVITGHLGLWNGKPEIVPVRCETVWDAIQKCNRSVDDVKVELKNGIINVYGYHHDGTNCFEIHKLSKKGIERYVDRDYDGFPELRPYHLAKFHGYLF